MTETAEKGRRRCIFCGGTLLTKEHVFPRWLRKHVQIDVPYNLHIGTFGMHVDGKAIWGERKDRRRPGDVRSQKLRVVCTACNNRWMSGLQLACKPILLSFI